MSTEHSHQSALSTPLAAMGQCLDCPHVRRAARLEVENDALRRQVLQLQGELTRSARCEVLTQ